MNHPKSMFQLSGVHCMVLAALQQSIKAAACNLFLIGGLAGPGIVGHRWLCREFQ